jgi:hypothetical protein
LVVKHLAGSERGGDVTKRPAALLTAVCLIQFAVATAILAA